MFKNAFEICKELESHGFPSMIAGGAVRDHLLGITPSDIDIASTALPEDVMRIFPKTIPTGLQHGTVSVIKNGELFEVTTLREDIKTDGRHAEVKFVDSFETDSKRRDFTINAMYMDYNGTVYDFHNGKEDLKIGIIRFVGNGDLRIKEDGLRVLRFFRFQARFGFVPSMSGLRACEYHAKTWSEKVSKERIAEEVRKTMRKFHMSIIIDMNNSGISESIFGKKLSFDNMCETLNTDEWHLRLMTMGMNSEWFKEHRFSNHIIKDIEFHESFKFDFDDRKYQIYKHGVTKIRKHLQITNNLINQKYIVAPVIDFPLNGHIVRNMGYNGPIIGLIIELAEKEWCNSNYTKTKEELIDLIKEKF